MPDVGKLKLGVQWDGKAVAGVTTHSTRPLAAQILKGKTPEQVVQIVPLLFSVCGKAQGAAARAALQAAGADGLEMAQSGRAIACEALQEHLWRLMLDWPKLLGQPAQEQRFAAWHGLLRKIAAGEAEMADFLHEFEQAELGMPAAQWRALTSGEMRAWWRKTATPLATMLAQLAEIAPHGAGEARLLPAWSAAEAQQVCTGKCDDAFAARPDWQGAAAETGAWSYYADVPLLCEAAQQHGTVMVRVLARLFDVIALAEGSAAERLDTVCGAAGEGIVAVRTARGLLLHRVQLEGGKVAEYQIVAPTEWNFHPDGVFAQDLRGMAVADEAALRQWVQIEVMSLDPCVAYEIEVLHA